MYNLLAQLLVLYFACIWSASDFCNLYIYTLTVPSSACTRSVYMALDCQWCAAFDLNVDEYHLHSKQTFVRHNHGSHTHCKVTTYTQHGMVLLLPHAAVPDADQQIPVPSITCAAGCTARMHAASARAGGAWHAPPCMCPFVMHTAVTCAQQDACRQV